MDLTEAEIKEVWHKYIDPKKDLVAAPNGEVLVSREASRRCADIFKLNLPENAQYRPKDILPVMVKYEKRKRAAAASVQDGKIKKVIECIQRAKSANKTDIKMAVAIDVECAGIDLNIVAEGINKAVNDGIIPSNNQVLDILTKVNMVAECIKRAKEEDKSDYLIASTILEEFPGVPFSIVSTGISKASYKGILPNDNLVKSNAWTIIQRASVTKQFLALKHNVKNPTVLAETLADRLFEHYDKSVLNLGHLMIALDATGISDSVIATAVERFYEKYEKKFVEIYSKKDMNEEEFIQEIYDKYLSTDAFDAGVLVRYIGQLNNKDLNIENIVYRLYQKEGDERAVYNILTTPGISVSDCVTKLRELDLQYPDYCIKRTFDLLKSGYYGPAYDEILELYMKEEPALEEIEEIEELKPITGVVTPLNEDGDNFEVSAEPEVSSEVKQDESEEITPRRLKILNKEKEVKSIEKKKTLATLLIGAGFIPVAALSLIFKTDPIVAAGNCVTALSQLSNGIGLEGILPSAGQLTTLLAGMGTTFVGFVKYLKNKKKLKGVKEELEELEELEQEEVKKGRR